MPAATVRVSDVLGTDLVSRVEALEKRLDRAPDPRAITLLVFSGEMDRLLAAFNVAIAAATSNMKVSMFFTFWGTTALKRRTLLRGKGVFEQAFALMLPGGSMRRSLSRFDFFGVGRRMMVWQMKRKNVSNLDELIAQAARSGVEVYACQMSMDLLGITQDELVEYPGLVTCGAAKFLSLASRANTTLFV